MVLVIDVDQRNVLLQEDGRMIIKLKYYSEFATAASMVAVEAETADEARELLDKPRGTKGVKRHKTLHVGVNGGMSLD